MNEYALSGATKDEQDMTSTLASQPYRDRVATAAMATILLASCLVLSSCSKKVKSEENLLGTERNPNGSLVERFDLTGNGKPNLWKHYKEEPIEGEKAVRKVLVRREMDLDNDGKIDVKQFFGRNDTLTRAKFDLDYDGQFDATEYYKDGKPVKREWDRNGDGRPEIIKLYQLGKIVQKELDENNDGKVDVWEYYEEGKLVRVGRDKDGDGKPELFDDRPDENAAGNTGG
jgi:hypothetical protein